MYSICMYKYIAMYICTVYVCMNNDEHRVRLTVKWNNYVTHTVSAQMLY